MFTLDMLNLRNIARYPVLGCPAQRLMSRQTQTTLPVPKQLLQPRVLKPSIIQAQLQHKRETQKQSYDKTSRPLEPQASGQVVRLQTDMGLGRLGTIRSPAPEPCSYMVDSNGETYWQKCQHLLPVKESKPMIPYPDVPGLCHYMTDIFSPPAQRLFAESAPSMYPNFSPPQLVAHPPVSPHPSHGSLVLHQPPVSQFSPVKDGDASLYRRMRVTFANLLLDTATIYGNCSSSDFIRHQLNLISCTHIYICSYVVFLRGKI